MIDANSPNSSDGVQQLSSIASSRNIAESQRRNVRDRQLSRTSCQTAFESALKSARKSQSLQDMPRNEARSEDGVPMSPTSNWLGAAHHEVRAPPSTTAAEPALAKGVSAALKSALQATDALPPPHGRWHFELTGDALPIAGIVMLRSPAGALGVSVQAAPHADMPAIELQLQRLRQRLLEHGAALDAMDEHADARHE